MPRLDLSDFVVRLDRAVRRSSPSFPYFFTAVGPTTVRVTCKDGSVVGIVTREAAWINDQRCRYMDMGTKQVGTRLERSENKSNSWWIDVVAEKLIGGLEVSS